MGFSVPAPLRRNVPTLELKDFRTRRLGPIAQVFKAQCSTIDGPSGSGKTLLLRAIADLDPHQGQAFLDGSEQRASPAPQWRRQVAYLPAESHWWADRVGAHFEHADDVLFEQLGFPLDVMDWDVTRLSSGERQRLALIRMLELKPRVLLLDEPTANLDGTSRERVEALILGYLERNDAIALWVSHDLDQRNRLQGPSFRIAGAGLTEEFG